MAENENVQNQEEELDDEELAVLANKELKKREEEIKSLKKEIAKLKLYSNGDEEDETESLSKEECITRLSDSCTTNYDYAEAVVNLVDIEVNANRPNPLGKNGKEVRDFFEECLEECDGDKSRFTSIYQSKIGSDDPQIALAYKNRNKLN